MDIVLATKNKGKVKEVKELFEQTGFIIKTMDEVGCHIDVLEDGTTFLENALKKATEIFKITGGIVMSDDSGLEIDFLNKQPGVLSSRFLGEETPYEIKNNKILKLLANVPYEKRTARFVCCIAVALKDGSNFTVTETIEGYISEEVRGSGGFGYDPIFYIEQYKKTMSELDVYEKNKISHRGKALAKVRKKLEEDLHK